MKLMQNTLLASFLLAGIINNVNASSVTYDYVGNDFTNFAAIDPLTNNLSSSQTLPSHLGPRITGSATFANGIDNPVTNYMLTDGKNTLDNTSNGPSFAMTFINNNVQTWLIALTNFDGNVGASLYTQGDYFTIGNGLDKSIYYEYTNGQILFANDFAQNAGLQGTWTLHEDQVSSVPVPAALPLMASALGLFGFGSMRRKS